MIYKLKYIPLLLVLMNLSSANVEWPEWRGPNGLGHSDAENLPTTWGMSPRM